MNLLTTIWIILFFYKGKYKKVIFIDSRNKKISIQLIVGCSRNLYADPARYDEMYITHGNKYPYENQINSQEIYENNYENEEMIKWVPIEIPDYERYQGYPGPQGPPGIQGKIDKNQNL